MAAEDNSIIMERVLEEALNPHQETRNNAELKIKQFLQVRPLEALQVLPTVVTRARADGVRQLAAVYLRKHFEALTSKVPPEELPNVLNSLRSQLLSVLVNESQRTVRFVVADTFAELASSALYENHWDASLVIQPLAELVSSNISEFKEMSAIILSKMSDCFCDVFPGDVPALKELIAPLFRDNTLAVRIAALKAICSLIISMVNSDDLISQFRELIPYMMQILSDSITMKDVHSHLADEVLTTLAEVCSTEPLFFEDVFEDFCALLCQISTSENLESDLRQLAFECLIAICENAPNIVRNSQKSLGMMFTVAFSFLLCVNENVLEWVSTDQEPYGEDSDEAFVEYGEEIFDRIAQSLKGPTVTPVYLHLLKQYLESNDWRCVNAGVISLSQVGEALPFETVSQLIPFVVNLLHHENLRIQHSALNCLGQLSADFGTRLAGEFHSVIVPNLLQKLSQEYASMIKIQSMAAAATINFAENCPQENLINYLDSILGALFERIQNGSSMVQEQVITAIASIADSVGTHFVPYYNIFVPIVKSVIQSCFPFSNEVLPVIDNLRKNRRVLAFRGRALECFSFVACAVGKDQCLADAHDIMQLVLNQENLILQTALAAEQYTKSKSVFEAYFIEDPSFSYLLQSWNRLFGVVKGEFAPYLADVLEFVYVGISLGSAAEQAAAAAVNEDSYDEESYSSARGMGTLEEKLASVDLIFNLISNLQNELAPHIEKLASYLIPMITYSRSDKIRRTALQCCPSLVQIAFRSQSVEFSRAFYIFILDSLHSASTMEFNVSVHIIELMILRILFDMKLGAINPALEFTFDSGRVSQFMKVIFSCIKSSTCRYAHRIQNQRFSTKDIDAQVARHEEEIEEEFCLRLFEFSRAGAKCFGSVLFSSLQSQEIFSQIHELLTNGPRVPKRMGCLVLSVFAEALGETFGELFPALVPLVVQLLKQQGDKENSFIDVQRSAAYCLGIFSLYCPTQFKIYSSDLCNLLFEMINQCAVVTDPKQRSDINSVILRDAFISAFGKIVLSSYQEADQERLISLWLDMLPLKCDVLEGMSCCAILCSCVQQNDARIIGRSMERLPRIVEIMLSVIQAPWLPKELFHTMRMILMRVHKGPEEIRNACFENLTPQQSTLVMTLLSDPVS